MGHRLSRREADGRVAVLSDSEGSERAGGDSSPPREQKEAQRGTRHRCARRGRPLGVADPSAQAEGARGVGVVRGCYLVDPASSHMLVSKIKPCMCKYELIQTVKLRMAH